MGCPISRKKERKKRKKGRKEGRKKERKMEGRKEGKKERRRKKKRKKEEEEEGRRRMGPLRVPLGQKKRVFWGVWTFLGVFWSFKNDEHCIF